MKSETPQIKPDSLSAEFRFVKFIKKQIAQTSLPVCAK